tara:strand:+ start:1068 stop:1484 length:417 start_codon:yes stop_codon:yes gene_type:complete
MNKTLGSVVWNFGLRKSTIKKFCTDFGINYVNQFSNFEKELLKPNFINFIKNNKVFFSNYNNDYYKDKTPEEISNKIDLNINIVELYLKHYYPEYFINNIFVPKKEYSLRYLSSYKISYELGNVFDFIDEYKTIDSRV